MSKKLRESLLIFVNSISLQTEKENILEFLIHSIHYTRTTTVNDALNVATELGLNAVKTANKVASFATLGIAGKVMDETEKLIQKSLLSEEAELAKVWEQKLTSQITLAKDKYCSMFGGDKEFASQIADRNRQLSTK